MVEKAKAIDPTKYSSKFDGILIKIRETHTDEEIDILKSLIKSNPGEIAVKVISYKDGATKVMVLKNKVAMSEELEKVVAKFQ